MEYYDVYHFCHLANASINNINYLKTNGIFLDSLDKNWIKNNPFPKPSILRSFCEWLINKVINEQVKYLYTYSSEISFNPYLWIPQAIKIYENIDIPFENWYNPKEIQEYDDDDYEEIFFEFIKYLNQFKGDLYFRIIEKIASEVEFILFQNRTFLLKFNELISCLFEKDPIIRKSPPKWVQNAIYHRDNATCIICGKDLSGNHRRVEEREIHYDHIVPLDIGGINDICNMQLTCKSCNLKKGINIKTEKFYQKIY
jgi:hypothetical protein